MMWNWLVSGIASGATLMLYDGSPFAPKESVLFDYAQDEKFTLFGTSAKYIDACKKAGLAPDQDARSVVVAVDDLDRLAAWRPKASITSTTRSSRICISPRSPAAPTSCRASCSAIRPRRCIAARSRPPGLGMAVDVWSDEGKHIEQEKGELVCTKPFVCMPVMFWNDADGKKYRAAYFERFAGVWCHGDFAEWTKHGGMIIHGRSDATLNPGGVRIGTAEIYAQVEQIPEVIEAMAIGQDWDNDVRVVLFVRCKEGVTLDDPLRDVIKKKIRTGATPRHVPAKIVQVADIPRTKSGKITELAVRDVVHGRAVKNTEALANPEALKLYEGLGELRT